MITFRDEIYYKVNDFTKIEVLKNKRSERNEAKKMKRLRTDKNNKKYLQIHITCRS